MTARAYANPNCPTCRGIGTLGPATGSPPRDYGRACPTCKPSTPIDRGERINCNGHNYHVYALGGDRCTMCGTPKHPGPNT